MKQFSDKAIVLRRTDYGERDRILTLITKQHGKQRVLAKSVRSGKSRLAGGIELLSISDTTFISGKSDLRTLTGARAEKHFKHIGSDLERVKIVYDALQLVDKLCEDEHGQEYFELLETIMNALDNEDTSLQLCIIWFGLHVLRLSGVSPRLRPEQNDIESFNFDFDQQAFVAHPDGAFSRDDLKVLYLSANHDKPIKLDKQLDSEDRLASFVSSLLKMNSD